MKFPQLEPLLRKVAPLRENASTEKVYLFVCKAVESANTPSMAQSACSAVATMCHPKAWGDMNVQNFGAKWTDWFTFLEELEMLATSCAQAIYEDEANGRARDG